MGEVGCCCEGMSVGGRMVLVGEKNGLQGILGGGGWYLGLEVCMVLQASRALRATGYVVSGSHSLEMCHWWWSNAWRKMSGWGSFCRDVWMLWSLCMDGMGLRLVYWFHC